MKQVRTSLAATVLATTTLVGVPSPVDPAVEPARPGGESGMTRTTISYGQAPEQFGELWLPGDRSGALPVVMLVHGGFWRAMYGLDLMDPLASDLVERGYAVWNIEYRRVGQDGGGYPGTLEDVAAAADLLVAIDGGSAGSAGDVAGALDLTDVTYIGHSAGGHLAFWAAGRDTIARGRPGADPRVLPRLVIGQGPVGNLPEAVRLDAGNGAVVELMGGSPAQLPDEYAVANPHIGSGVHVVVLRGEIDDTVFPPYTVPRADGLVTVIDVPGDNHIDLIDPTSDSWARAVELLAQPAG
jgi:hypothetical protein